MPSQSPQAPAPQNIPSCRWLHLKKWPFILHHSLYPSFKSNGFYLLRSIGPLPARNASRLMSALYASPHINSNQIPNFPEKYFPGYDWQMPRTSITMFCPIQEFDVIWLWGIWPGSLTRKKWNACEVLRKFQLDLGRSSWLVFKWGLFFPRYIA